MAEKHIACIDCAELEYNAKNPAYSHCRAYNAKVSQGDPHKIWSSCAYAWRKNRGPKPERVISEDAKAAAHAAVYGPYEAEQARKAEQEQEAQGETAPAQVEHFDETPKRGPGRPGKGSKK